MYLKSPDFRCSATRGHAPGLDATATRPGVPAHPASGRAPRHRSPDVRYNRPIEPFTDRLAAECERKGAAVCVGIDPVLERLPGGLADDGAPLDRIVCFVEQVLEAVADHVPCVKFQSACFERYRAEGVAAYDHLVACAHEHGLLVIGDVKRGDIGASAGHYAAANLDDEVSEPGAVADAITINGWCGADGVEPFIHDAARGGRGLFVWVRASNPSSDAFQALRLEDGRTVSEAMAGIVAGLGEAEALRGACGYSLLGAVVGATKPSEAVQLRKLMPRQWFLVPGFGAQGGGAEDVRACFNDDGRGALITASRSILYAYEKQDGDWRRAVAGAATAFRDQIRGIVGDG